MGISYITRGKTWTLDSMGLQCKESNATQVIEVLKNNFIEEVHSLGYKSSSSNSLNLSKQQTPGNLQTYAVKFIKVHWAFSYIFCSFCYL